MKRGNERQFERQDLYSYLTEHPLYATLLLCPVPRGNNAFTETVENKCLALLARLYAAKSASDYASYLHFDKKVLGQPLPLTLKFILSASPAALQKTIQDTGENQEFRLFSESSSLFITSPQRFNNSRSITDGTNRYQKKLTNNKNSHAFFEENTDEEGDELSQGLGIASSQALTDEQERRQFQRQKVGLQRALYNNESKVAFGLQAATNAELALLIDAVSPALLSNDFTALNKEDSYFFLLLFLKLWGIKEPGALILKNTSNKAGTTSRQAYTIEYYLVSKRLSTEAKVTLNARLSNSQPAELSDERWYKNSQPLVTLQLPFPLQSLLNNVVRKISPGLRQGRTLTEALSLSNSWYRKKLNALLKNSGLKTKGLTPNAIHNAFHQFAAETVSESFLAFLSGEGTVQSYYVNSHMKDIELFVGKAWYQFIEHIGFIDWKSESSEAQITRDGARTWHDDVGSPYTLPDKLHSELLKTVNRNIENTLGQGRSYYALKHAFFYVYYRLATNLGLRPVKEPFPEFKHYNSKKGVFTVADKRVHHPNERRLIFLTPTQNLLMMKTQELARAASYQLKIKLPSHLVMDLNIDEGCWQHFSSVIVEQYLTELSGEFLKAGGLRHQSAQSFLKSHERNFSQTALNTLLNHSRAGVRALSASSLLPIGACQQAQAEYLERIDKAFETHDEHFLLLTQNLLAQATL
ncbi:MAG: hypothetical protein ACQEQ2_05590 [Pseudomonadota bacterium]